MFLFDICSKEDLTKVTVANIRPRACRYMQWDELKVGNKVMVNYNLDHPKEIGFWYDAIISRKVNKRNKALYAKLELG